MDSERNIEDPLNTSNVNNEVNTTNNDNSKNNLDNNVTNEKAQSKMKIQVDNIQESIKDKDNCVHDDNDTGLNVTNDSAVVADRTPSSVVIKNVDNTSLCNLLLYSSDDSDTETSDFESNDEEDSQLGEAKAIQTSKSNAESVLKKNNELGLEDLPPVPDLSSLKIDITGEDCEQMGVISSIVDRLVIIESLPNIPAYDIDTLLFLENGKTPLGYIHDVLGPVSSPMYAVRFNTREEIDNLKISKGLPVYCAPKTVHTQYVFLKQLLEAKGSDASWTDDIEVPPEFADFSDDETESATRRKKAHDLNSNKKRNSFDLHKNFEKNMNVRNILDTRLHKIRDSCEPQNKKHVANTKITHASTKSCQPCVQHPYRFSPIPGINNVPSMQQVHGYYRMPPYGMSPQIFPPPNYRSLPFVPYNSPPPIPPPNAPSFRNNRPLPPPPPTASAVFLNPPPPGVDVTPPREPQLMMHLTPTTANTPQNLQNFYNTPPPPPPPHINWYMTNNLPPTTSGTFGGIPYYQKP